MENELQNEALDYIISAVDKYKDKGKYEVHSATPPPPRHPTPPNQQHPIDEPLTHWIWYVCASLSFVCVCRRRRDKSKRKWRINSV